MLLSELHGAGAGAGATDDGSPSLLASIAENLGRFSRPLPLLLVVEVRLRVEDGIALDQQTDEERAGWAVQRCHVRSFLSIC